MATLASVNVGARLTARWAGRVGHTGIDKRPVTGPVEVERLGLEDDQISHRRIHGGPDQALYAFATEDLAWWSAELGRDLGPGNAGENLSTAGYDLTNAVIGERWAVGTALLQVSAPRLPCRVLAGFWQAPDLMTRFTARAAPGGYLRVLTEGSVSAGDRIEVVDRPTHGVTVGVAFRAVTVEPALLPRLLDVPDLAKHFMTDVRKADARNGDARNGKARNGKARNGDARNGKARNDDARNDDARKRVGA